MSGSAPSVQHLVQELPAAPTLGASGGTATLTVRKIGQLWAGYGSISEVCTEAGDLRIVKEVRPPLSSGPSHERKLRSYQVEAAFYERVAPRLPAGAACHVPRCLEVSSTLCCAAAMGAACCGDSGRGSDNGSSGSMRLVMSDLRQEFPHSCATLDEAHAKAALTWLAAFHAACWGGDAARLGLWEEGSYWHLQTRLAELEAMGPEWRALQAAAGELDARLAATPWRTLCHGDFKGQNLQFSASSSSSSRGSSGLQLQGQQQGQQQQQNLQFTGGSSNSGSSSRSAGPPVSCAAVDFQYCGGGSGARDLAKLFCNSLAPALLDRQGRGEEALLRHYHAELMRGLAALAASAGGSSGADGSSSNGGSSADGSVMISSGGNGGSGGSDCRLPPVGCPAKAAEALRGYTFEALRSDFGVALADYVRFSVGWPGGLWGNTSWAAARARATLAELGLG